MSRVAAVDTWIVTLPRDTPYLGPLGPGETVNDRGYIVRKGNGTIYPTVDRSILVRVRTEDGATGWGETYGICAPRATCEIVNELLAPVLVGMEAEEVETIWGRLYRLMRVRGAATGFYGDALAALDIALWDCRARAAGMPLHALLGARVHERVPAYVSGLPAATLAERVAMACTLQNEGHRAFKFAAVVSHEGLAAEMAALREALGPDVEIMADLHWKYAPDEALRLAGTLAPHRPFFLEAPVAPEDVAGLARVAAEAPVAIAAGEEWYNEYEAANRLAVTKLAFLQPEMGHTGITQFLRIAALGLAHGASIAPHATIGTGLFLAASLHAAAALPHLWAHEWQHSVLGGRAELLEGGLRCDAGGYVLPEGPGLGVAPSDRLWGHAVHVA